MLNIDEISKLVEEAYAKIRFLSFDEKGFNYTYIFAGGLAGKRKAINKIKEGALEPLHNMLDELEGLIKVYVDEMPAFLKKVSKYQERYNNPLYNGTYSTSPNSMLKGRLLSLLRLQEIYLSYVFHQHVTKKQNNSLTETDLNRMLDSVEKFLEFIELIEKEVPDVYAELVIDPKKCFILAENGFVDLAVKAWLHTSPKSDLYEKAHFEAFQCVYHAKKEAGIDNFSAFLDALPCCYSNENTLINFFGDNQKVFKSILINSVGIKPSFETVDSLSQEKIKTLLKFVLLKAAQDDLKLTSTPKVRKPDSLFAEPRVQGLLSKMEKYLPSMPLSLENLQELDKIINGINNKHGLWGQAKLGIDAAQFHDDNLRYMLEGIYKQEAADEVAETANVKSI